LAIEEWWREKQGVQQDLLSTTGEQPIPQVGKATPAQPLPVVQASSGAEQWQLGLNGYDNSVSFMGTCPDCGSQLEYAEGCVKCHVCGFSECG
jgi:ribonucleoside-diphosphate reductase alpha chain